MCRIFHTKVGKSLCAHAKSEFKTCTNKLFYFFFSTSRSLTVKFNNICILEVERVEILITEFWNKTF